MKMTKGKVNNYFWLSLVLKHFHRPLIGWRKGKWEKSRTRALVDLAGHSVLLARLNLHMLLLSVGVLLIFQNNNLWIALVNIGIMAVTVVGLTMLTNI